MWEGETQDPRESRGSGGATREPQKRWRGGSWQSLGRRRDRIQEGQILRFPRPEALAPPMPPRPHPSLLLLEEEPQGFGTEWVKFMGLLGLYCQYPGEDGAVPGGICWEIYLKY